MPAAGTKKKNPLRNDKRKGRVLNLRAEPELADRVVAEGDGSVTSGMRTVINAGLDTLERRRLGIEDGG